MPAASSTLACNDSSFGTAGFCAIPVRNEAVSAAMRTEPASAVPSEAPNCVAVFWRPPTSGLFSLGTDETVTLPSCEARPPMPSPINSSGTVTISALAPTSIGADEHQEADDHRQETGLDDPPRRSCREEPGYAGRARAAS